MRPSPLLHEGHRRRARAAATAATAATAAAAALFLAVGCHRRGGSPPLPPDVATVKPSARGVYRAAVRPAVDPIPVRRLHAWTLHLETAAGVPVDAAVIAADGEMPGHGHGMPTRPRVRRALGGGDHAVDGMKFSMGGWWRVRFAIRAAAGVNTVVFNLSL